MRKQAQRFGVSLGHTACVCHLNLKPDCLAHNFCAAGPLTEVPVDVTSTRHPVWVDECSQREELKEGPAPWALGPAFAQSLKTDVRTAALSLVVYWKGLIWSTCHWPVTHTGVVAGGDLTP
jgi:hypothetical protein